MNSDLHPFNPTELKSFKKSSLALLCSERNLEYQSVEGYSHSKELLIKALETWYDAHTEHPSKFLPPSHSKWLSFENFSVLNSPEYFNTSFNKVILFDFINCLIVPITKRTYYDDLEPRNKTISLTYLNIPDKFTQLFQTKNKLAVFTTSEHKGSLIAFSKLIGVPLQLITCESTLDYQALLNVLRRFNRNECDIEIVVSKRNMSVAKLYHSKVRLYSEFFSPEKKEEAVYWCKHCQQYHDYKSNEDEEASVQRAIKLSMLRNPSINDEEGAENPFLVGVSKMDNELKDVSNIKTPDLLSSVLNNNEMSNITVESNIKDEEKKDEENDETKKDDVFDEKFLKGEFNFRGIKRKDEINTVKIKKRRNRFRMEEADKLYSLPFIKLIVKTPFDITFSYDSEKINCHRILAYQSSYLRYIIDCSDDKVVLLKHYDFLTPEILRIIVDSFYGLNIKLFEYIDDDEKDIINLLLSVKLFELLSLEIYICSVLYIDSSNVIKFYEWSYENDLLYLKRTCIRYFRDHENIESIKKIEKRELLIDILINNISNKAEDGYNINADVSSPKEIVKMYLRSAKLSTPNKNSLTIICQNNKRVVTDKSVIVSQSSLVREYLEHSDTINLRSYSREFIITVLSLIYSGVINFYDSCMDPSTLCKLIHFLYDFKFDELLKFTKKKILSGTSMMTVKVLESLVKTGGVDKLTMFQTNAGEKMKVLGRDQLMDFIMKSL